MRIVSPTGKRLSFNDKRLVFDVSPGPGPTPTSIIIDGVEYGIVKIGNQYWTTKDLNLNLNTSNEYHENGVGYYQYNTLNTAINEYLQNNGLSSWRVPTYSDMRTLVNFVKSDNGLSSDSAVCAYLYKVDAQYHYQTNNKYGFSLEAHGAYDNNKRYLVNNSIYGNANVGYISSSTSSTYRSYFGNTGPAYGEGSANGYKVVVRLVMDAEV